MLIFRNGSYYRTYMYRVNQVFIRLKNYELAGKVKEVLNTIKEGCFIGRV